MSVNENLITVKANHPDPDVDNVEVTIPNTAENWDTLVSYLGKCKIDGLNLRTLTPRNRYGAAGMPVDVKIAKLMQQLEQLQALQESAA